MSRSISCVTGIIYVLCLSWINHWQFTEDAETTRWKEVLMGADSNSMCSAVRVIRLEGGDFECRLLTSDSCQYCRANVYISYH